jgi:hypothetical protein
MHKSIKSYKYKILGQGRTLLLSFKTKMIRTFVGNCSTNQVWAPLSWLQVHQYHVSFSQPTYHLGKEKWLYKEKGSEGKAEAKTHNWMQNLGEEGEGILAEFSYYLARCSKLDPKTSFCMRKRWLFSLGMGYNG